MNEYAWILWLAAVIAFGILEAATVSVVSVWFVGGALAALIASLLGAGWVLQIVLFFAVSAILLACLRPFIKKFVTPKRTATNTDAAIGKQAIITEAVDNLRGTGALKLEGKEWSVRSAGGEEIPVGTLVTIKKVEGVKLLVETVQAAVTV